jgi:hypothetical protein
MKKEFLTGLTAMVLAIGFVLAGCESPTSGSAGTPGNPGDPGLAVNGPVATTYDGVVRYFAEGNPTVYLLGGITVDAAHPLTIGAGKTLVVTSYTDLNSRSVAADSVGGITVAAGGTGLVIADSASDAGGALYFRAGTTFTAAADATVTVTQTQTNFGVIWFETGNEIADVATLTAMDSKVIFVATAVPPVKVVTGDTEGLGGEAANTLASENALALIREAAKLETAIAVPASVAIADPITAIVYKSGQSAAEGITKAVTAVESAGSNTYLTLTTGVVTLKAQNETDADDSTTLTVTLTKSVTRTVTVTLTVAFQPVLNTLGIAFDATGATAVGDIKFTVSGLTSPAGGNTVDYKFSENEVIAPAKGTDPSGTDITAAVTSGTNVSLDGTGNKKVGEWLTVYELTSTNKVVNYKSVQIANGNVKYTAPTSTTTLDTNGYGKTYQAAAGYAFYAVPTADIPNGSAAFDTGTGTAITADTQFVTLAGAYRIVTVHSASGAYAVSGTDITVAAYGGLPNGPYTGVGTTANGAGEINLSGSTLTYGATPVTVKLNTTLDEDLIDLLTAVGTGGEFTVGTGTLTAVTLQGAGLDATAIAAGFAAITDTKLILKGTTPALGGATVPAGKTLTIDVAAATLTASPLLVKATGTLETTANGTILAGSTAAQLGVASGVVTITGATSNTELTTASKIYADNT